MHRTIVVIAAGVVIVALCALTAASALAVELYSDQPLYGESTVKSEVVGKALHGDVSVIERRGFWVKIKAGDSIGWTRLSNISMQETTQWMRPIDVLNDTGRLGQKGLPDDGKKQP